MKRLFSVLVLMLVMTGGSATAPAPATPKAAARPISLGIADTGQEPRRPQSGWCGEAAIQMALSYYGAYASQKAINRAGKPEHPDLDAPEIPRAMRNMGLDDSH